MNMLIIIRRIGFYALSALIIAQHSITISAQISSTRNQSAKTAAQIFYQKYLPIFGYPLEPDLLKLRPYVSPGLYSLLTNELHRMRAWSVKNPDMKPPVMEDLFVCNHYDKPQRFRIGKAQVEGNKASIDVNFEYTDNGRIIDTCKVRASFILKNGKWLLDNVWFEQGVDLKTLLSRKDYATLPG